MIKNTKLLVRVIFLFSLFLSIIVIPTYAQKVAKQIKKSADYEYKLGEKIGHQLNRQCSASTALIKDVKGNQVIFSVIEYHRFTQDETSGEKKISIEYNRRKILRYDSSTYVWWSYIDFSPGTKVMVFYCKDKWIFATSDSKYFDKIKGAISLTKSFKDDYNNLINYFENDFSSDDEIVKAIALKQLLVNPAPPDVTAYVVASLMVKREPKERNHGVQIRGRLRHILSHNLYLQIPNLRAKAFTKLVAVAGGDDEMAKEATFLLAGIAESNPDELRKYIKAETAGNILLNLQSIDPFSFSGDKGESLKNLLIGK